MRNALSGGGQAVVVRYHHQVGAKGARISARCPRGCVFIDYPHELNRDARYIAAFVALVNKFLAEDKERGIPVEKNPWSRDFVWAEIKDSTYVFVFVNPQEAA